MVRRVWNEAFGMSVHHGVMRQSSTLMARGPARRQHSANIWRDVLATRHGRAEQYVCRLRHARWCRRQSGSLGSPAFSDSRATLASARASLLEKDLRWRGRAGGVTASSASSAAVSAKRELLPDSSPVLIAITQLGTSSGTESELASSSCRSSCQSSQILDRLVTRVKGTGFTCGSGLACCSPTENPSPLRCSSPSFAGTLADLTRASIPARHSVSPPS
mmetsp:Transcript_13179/g.32902  ORF Transcript_13179/g.32902 Transcript_13179/m.32902 type:complete len:219 (+) Transcript_13179:203-859(+)